MKKLPVGIQSFEKLINGNYEYVDKTEQIYRLISGGQYYFLSRPRRFGKSLLCSTLEELFQGNRNLFNGLWIDSSNYTWEKYPVVTLDFTNIRHETPQDLKDRLLNKIIKIARNHNINYNDGMVAEELFSHIIESLAQKNKVVLLIDEYDNPIIDHLHNPKVAHQMREILRNFYSTIKPLDRHLRFVFLTGVSKFSKTSIFSGINNLEDLTLTRESATLLGYTQNELLSYFDGYINSFAQQQNTTKEYITKKMQSWYDGYRFYHNSEPVYNPFSVLLSFKQLDFDNYWFETGTPLFLVNLLKEKNFPVQDLEGIRVQAEDIKTFDIENIAAIPLLFQTGYLTIKQYDSQTRYYCLGYPNEEVRNSFFNRLLSGFTELEPSLVKGHLLKLIEAIKNNNVELFLQKMQNLLAQIPYTIHVKQEKYYQTIFYLIGTLLGVHVDAEVVTNTGRIDFVISTSSHIYLFEFKMDQPSQRGFDQIEEKKYSEKYQSTRKKLVLIGVAFDSEKRNISSDWIIKQNN